MPALNNTDYEFNQVTASASVILYALIMGVLREIPLGWRLIDCAFGLVGFVPLWLAWRLTGRLEPHTGQ